MVKKPVRLLFQMFFAGWTVHSVQYRSYHFIYSVTVFGQKSKDCAPSGSFQHNTAVPLFLCLMFAVLLEKSPLIIILIVYAYSCINCDATCPWLVVVQQRVAAQ